MAGVGPVLKTWQGEGFADRLKAKYGMSEEDYADMYERQDGKCAICREPGHRLAVDHDHKTLAVRGLLCTCCNSLLGMAKDSSARLFRAIGYLREAASREPSDS